MINLTEAKKSQVTGVGGFQKSYAINGVGQEKVLRLLTRWVGQKMAQKVLM